MSAQNDGGPAFPARPGSQWESDGMSLRDWFAGQETLSDCADISFEALEAALGRKMTKFSDNRLGYLTDEAEARAKLKLLRADAMLAARKGGQS